MPSVERLRERLTYVPQTGRLIWRHSGRTAGCLRKDGYRVVRVDDVLLYEHRVAWAIVHGVWVNEIDHKDRVPSNNVLLNLRPAEPVQNKWNTRRPITNTSGFKGVAWHKQAKRWRAYFKQDGRQVSLGLFDTAEAAFAVYCAAVAKARGEFTHVGT